MALFTVTVKEGQTEGARRYLFSIGPGEALFGTAPSPDGGEHKGILAVAVEETELLKVSLEHLGKLVTKADAKAVALLEDWIHRLGSGLSGVSTSASSVQAVAGTRYLSLTEGQTLQALQRTVSWVRVTQGRARWMGFKELTLDPEFGVLPLGAGMWLEADGIVEVATADTSEIQDLDTLLGGLTQLHSTLR